VNFGQPVSMRERAVRTRLDSRVLDDAARRAAVARVGQDLMTAIGKVVPVLPVPLVASIFMRDLSRSLSELELKAEVLALVTQVEARGAHVYVPRADRDYALTVGLRMLTLRHLVREAGCGPRSRGRS
jgi:glycerol-3-phosphate O-acyltransferase